MKNIIDLDRYLTLKDINDYTVFIFLLGGEYPHLNNESSWVHYVKERVYLVRLQEDEFGMLDIGVHPKTIVYRNGREIREYNGIPRLPRFKSDMQKVRRRSVDGSR